MDVISLVVLFGVILVAYKCKVNTGLLGIAAAFVLGFFLLTHPTTGNPVPLSSAAGKAKEIIGGWSSSMFLTLFGVTFLFGIAEANNTLNILTHKLVFLVKGKRSLLPIVIYIVAFIISVIGPGPVNGVAIVAPIAAQVAFSQNVNPYLMIIACYAGNLAGGLAPITPSGVVASLYSAKGGVDLGYGLLWNMFILFTLIFIVAYIVMRGWKIAPAPEKTGDGEEIKATMFNYITMGVIVLVIGLIIAAKLNVGLCALTGGVFLLLVGAATEKQALSKVPWGTILMVCGMGVMVGIVGYAGGIKYLTDSLTPFINESTAVPIMVLTGALFSAIASASGVVMPTLIPVAIMLATNLGLDPKPLIYGVVAGAHLSCISPFSTVGGMSLGALGDKVDNRKFFLFLLEFAIGITVIGAILVYFKVLLYY